MTNNLNPGRLAVLLLSISLFLSACSNAVEEDTNKILMQYNEAFGEYHTRIAQAQNTFSYSSMLAFNMYQSTWDKVKQEYRLDSLCQAFYDAHGEKEYNKLMLKVDDNFNQKMN